MGRSTGLRAAFDKPGGAAAGGRVEEPRLSWEGAERSPAVGPGKQARAAGRRWTRGRPRRRRPSARRRGRKARPARRRLRREDGAGLTAPAAGFPRWARVLGSQLGGREQDPPTASSGPLCQVGPDTASAARENLGERDTSDGGNQTGGARGAAARPGGWA